MRFFLSFLSRQKLQFRPLKRNAKLNKSEEESTRSLLLLPRQKERDKETADALKREREREQLFSHFRVFVLLFIALIFPARDEREITPSLQFHETPRDVAPSNNHHESFAREFNDNLVVDFFFIIFFCQSVLSSSQKRGDFFLFFENFCLFERLFAAATATATTTATTK